MGYVRKRGEKWYFCIELQTNNGKRKRIERVGGKTKKEAMQNMALMEAEILTNGFKDKSKILFSELIDIWFNEYVMLNCSFNTQTAYRKNIKNHLEPYLGNYRVVDINTRIVQKFLNDKKKEGLSKNMVLSLKNVLSSAIKYAIYPLEIIRENPVQYATVPKFEDNKEKHILTQEELEAVFNAAPNDTVRNIFELLYRTGIRTGECLALQWSDIDFENKIIHINHNIIKKGDTFELASPKTTASIREVYIDDQVVSTLKRQNIINKENELKYGKFYEKSDFVFRRKDGKFLYTSYFSSVMSNIRKKTGIEVTMHTFRHTHATYLLEAGVNIKEIQSRLGHGNIKTTMNTYAKSTADGKKKAVEIFNNYLENKNNAL